MSARKSSHRTIFLIVSNGSPLALIASSLRSTSKKPVCPMTRSLDPPMAHCGQRVRFVATWREEFFEVPICDSPDLWSDTFHQFKPLTGHGWLEIREAGEIATWPRQALHHTRGDRVADLYKNRGRRAGGFPDRGSDRRRIGKDHIRAQVEQLFGELARMRYVAATPAVDELDIAAL